MNSFLNFLLERKDELTASSIASRNSIKDIDKIQAGTTIQIPGHGEYKIKSGDTLSGIASSFGSNKLTPGPHVGTYNYPKKDGTLGSRSPWELYPDPQKPEPTRRESPLSSSFRMAARRAAKLGGEFADLMPDLEREEDYKEFAYPDPLNPKTGPITVGIGSTRTSEASQIASDAGLDPSRVWNLDPNRRQGVSRDVARNMALASVTKNELKLRKLFPTWDLESPQTRNVFRSQGYNMGVGNPNTGAGLAGFEDMIAAVTAGDTEEARKQALDSKRAKEQVPARAKREAGRIVPRPKKDETTGRWYSPLPPK